MKLKSESWKTNSSGFIGNECSAFAPDGDLQKSVNDHIIKLAHGLKAPLLMTLDSHFVRPESKEVQDVLLQNGNPDGWRFSTVYSQLTTEQAWEKWVAQNGEGWESRDTFCEAVENNEAFVSRVEPIKVETRLHMPEVEIPEDIAKDPQTDWDSKLEMYVYRLILKYGRMPNDSRYVERLKKEIDIIARNGKVNFLPYFLVLALDICEYADQQGIPRGGGRGSAAGCLLSYLLRITHFDPIQYNLSFERFLTQGRINRGKFPDIDLDFGNPAAIVEHLRQKYGDKFARICTTGTMKVKDAIRNIGRIMFDTRNNAANAKLIDSIAKTVGNVPQGVDTRKWLYTGYETPEGQNPPHIVENPQLAAFLAEESNQKFKRILDGILDIPKSIGRHASAYCIADEPVADIVPMCQVGNAEDVETCTQYTMKPVEDMGLIKFDILGLNTLKDIAGCLRLIKERHNLTIDIYKDIPTDDMETYAAFHNGLNETVFQFNGGIPINLCRKIHPRSIFDLSDITAAGRPGTMYSLLEDGKTKLIDAWIARRQGSQVPSYVHPSMKHILESTLGIVIYQEQIMKLFEECCGYTPEQADEIREIVGKKKHEEMQKILPDIRQRLQDRGWKEDQIKSFVSLCVAASSYSFNKSHSVSYAYLGYACQYLKTHYPLEWWCSVLENANLDDIESLAPHCGHLVSPPDINRSDVDFYIIDAQRSKIVYPLRMVRGVKSASEAICRPDLRPYASIEDFYNKIDRRKVHAGVVKSLIWAGAFDDVHGVTEIEDRNEIYKRYLAARGDDVSGFRGLTELEILKERNDALSLGSADYSRYCEDKYGGTIQAGRRLTKVYGAQTLADLKGTTEAWTCGEVFEVKNINTKRNQPMAFVRLKNGLGTADITVFPELWAAQGARLTPGTVILARVKIQDYKGHPSFVTESITIVD